MNTDHQSSFVDALTQAARENPLAAALIGGGALWLLVGKGGARGVSSAYTELLRPTAELGLRNTRRAVKNSAAVHDEAEDLDDESRSAASDASATLSARAASLRNATAETANRAKDQISNLSDALPNMRKHYEGTRSALGELLEQQPLLLGAFGIAIGAGLASAAAVTRFERGWAGSTSHSFKAAVNDRTEDMIDAAGEAVSDIASDAKERAKRAADSVRQTAGRTAETTRL
jgi:ElaB/YqjD/DUF883 family membrane-anchored ribosome-binding protein